MEGNAKTTLGLTMLLSKSIIIFNSYRKFEVPQDELREVASNFGDLVRGEKGFLECLEGNEKRGSRRQRLNSGYDEIARWGAE